MWAFLRLLPKHSYFLMKVVLSSFKVSDRHLIFNPNKRSRKSYELISPYEIVEYHLDTLDTVYQKKRWQFSSSMFALCPTPFEN